MKVAAFFRRHAVAFVSGASLLLLVGFLLISSAFVGGAELSGEADEPKRLVSVYDGGERRVFLTAADTVGEALAEQGVVVDERDTVEPGITSELIAPEYHVNVYRARPVVVEDGVVRVRVITPYITPQQIIAAAGLHFYAEDETRFLQTPDITRDGAVLVLRIDRATPFMFDLYGRTSEVRTQAKTVGGMLEEKGITLGERDRVSVGLETPVVSGMSVRLWREGKQTITVDEPIPFETELVFDADREIGYRAVTAPGSAGIWAVSYEIEIKDGFELSRNEIARLVTKQPTKQVETVGVKPGPNALTKSKGAQYFVDSRGISHRETYYDLPMNVVMQACGQGGYYTVRSDGVKIDRDGYVIIAANYSRYPRCTVVETSVGLAKVYDTGGFALRHPEGFDIATDWTNYDGR